MADLRFTDLPVLPSLGGDEVVPVDKPNGDGTYTTSRTTTQDIAGLAVGPSGVSPGTYGDAANVPQITVDADGFVTNAVNVPISVAGTVTSVSVVSAHGLAGTVANPTSTPALTLSTTVTGVIKGDGTSFSAATAGTDYQAPITLTTTGTSGAATLVGNTLNVPVYAGATGTVTSVSVVSANGLAGTVANATTTPAITLLTSVTGILQGNGSAISAASTTGSGNVVLATSPTLVTPALGTPSALVATNATGTAAGLTAGTATVANGLKTATTTVAVSSATAPSAGQVLTATSSTAANWAAPAGGITPVTTRTALAALSTSLVVAYLEEAGRQGTFLWSSANLSTSVTADTLQGVYVPPASDTSGASGAWVRVYAEVLRPEWFGAIPDGATDCGPGLRACGTLISFFGKGAMQLSSGTYLVSTLSTNNRMLTPYANMTICGVGDESIIKLANGTSTTNFFGIYNGVSTSASTDCSNFCCRNFTIDYNGQNNQITSYTGGIYIAVGDNVVIDGVKTLNFPGSQPLVIGASYTSNGTTLLTTPVANRPQITNCRFHNIGNTIDANITDSSDIYVVCNDGIIAGNTFSNATQDTFGTAIELHGSGTCYGNTMYQKGKMFNVGAYPNTDWVVSGNKGRECCNFATLWDNAGTGVYFGLTVIFDGNELITSQLPTSSNAALINASSNVSGNGFALAIVLRNNIFSFLGTAGTSILPVLMIGQGNFYDFSGNTVQGYPAEVVVIDQTTGIKASGRTSLLFNDNKILNCCATSTAGHTTVVLLNEATNLLGSLIASGNYFHNDGGNMAVCFAGTAIPPGYIVTNTAVNGVATLGPSTTAAFTPVLTASTTNPTLGNSTLTGEYEIDGDYCIYRGKLTIGSTFSAGSGTYSWSLPKTPKTMLNTCFGHGLLLSTSAYLVGQSVIGAGTSSMQMHGFTTSSGAFSLVQNASPFAWATGNTAEWEIRYRIK